jgi:anaerobic ribonucleoside-triphosphate reductase activating protein
MRPLRIITTQYSIAQESLDIYVAGCNAPHCIDCFNPESWEYNQGTIYDSQFFVKRVRDKARIFPDLVKNIFIYGGEPLDSDVSELLFELSTLHLPLWLFTHYSLEEVPQYVKNYCSFIKCGRYDPLLKTEDNIQYGVKLATCNQRIYKKDIDF